MFEKAKIEIYELDLEDVITASEPLIDGEETEDIL